MTDKYRHLAPRKPRECFKQEGRVWVPKKRYETEEHAEAARQQHIRDGLPGAEEKVAYTCSTCGYGHLGTPRQRRP